MLGLAGCETAGDHDPVNQPKSTLAEGRVLRVASTVKGTEAGRTVIDGGGVSMVPVMGENTIVVISPVAYEALQIDMIVAYRNRAGVRIIHQLIRHDPDGWVARGWNNASADPEKVTPHNLLGVVYGTFQSADPLPSPR